MDDGKLKESLIKIGKREPGLRDNIREILDALSMGTKVRVKDTHPSREFHGMVGTVKRIDEKHDVATIDWEGVHSDETVPRSRQNVKVKHLEIID